MKENFLTKVLVASAFLVVTSLLASQAIAQEGHVMVAKVQVNNGIDNHVLLAKLHSIQAQTLAVDAVLQNSVDERERRNLLKRLRSIHGDLASLIAEIRPSSSSVQAGAHGGGANIIIAMPTSPSPPVVEEPVIEEPEPVALRMSGREFDSFFQRWEETPFEDDRRALLQMGIRDQLITVSQTRRLIEDRMGIMEDEALNIIDYLAPYLADPKNAYTLIDVMKFSDGKQRLEKILNRKLPR